MTPDELRDRLDETSKAVLALVDEQGPRVAVQLEGQEGRVRELRRQVLVRAAVRGYLDRETLDTWGVIDQMARVVQVISDLQRSCWRSRRATVRRRTRPAASGGR